MGKIHVPTTDQPINGSNGTSLITDTPAIAGRVSPCLWLSGVSLHFLVSFFSASESLPHLGELPTVAIRQVFLAV